MREILFRGKRADNGEWVEGYYSNLGGNSPRILKENIFIGKIGRILEFENIKIIPETRGEFTGLTDKNGVKIFEGDIIKHYIKNSEIVKTYIVEWESRLTKFVGRYMGDEYYGHKYAYAEIHEELIYEVIGNIHDNPELLEGGADNG